jgi:hypothetical protein
VSSVVEQTSLEVTVKRYLGIHMEALRKFTKIVITIASAQAGFRTAQLSVRS